MFQNMLLWLDLVVEPEKKGISTGWIVAIIILVVLIGAFIGLTILGKKLQKKQEESEAAMHQGAQIVSIFVIEKSRKKIVEAGFPQIIVDQTPKYPRRSKVPVVKAKVGPKIASLMCDEKAFNLIPEKKEVKVLMNGIYIVEAKSARGGLEAPPVKKTWRQKLRDKYDSLRKDEQAAQKNTKGKKNTAESKDAAKSQKKATVEVTDKNTSVQPIAAAKNSSKKKGKK